MNDLVQFLRDRLDEDEALAREAPAGPWHIGNAVDPTQPCNVHTFPGARMVADGLNWLVAEHIARQNPARVLAEVEAKRAMLDSIACAEIDHEYWSNQPTANSETRTQMETRWSTWSFVLSQLVKPYVDHPDYRQEWRP